jgi:peroxiredoxin (alkyl hydroperoxide reductase subunit C)
LRTFKNQISGNMKKISLLLVIISCGLFAWSQGEIPMLGEQAPSFTANTTNGKLEFPEDFGKSWKILLSHPKDFTPVCTSEILELAKMQDEFDKLGVKLAVISTDDLTSHQDWKQYMEGILMESTGHGKIDFPLIDDQNGRISNMYGMLHAWENPTRDVRGVFIVSPSNEIKSINFYPLNIGRNMEEIKRVVVALQTSEREEVLIPANWKQGDNLLMKYVPYTSEELANNPELANQYYKVGINMWYRKTQ